MASEERKQRERERKRRLILDAAKKLFVREGYREVSLRRIARTIDYSPAAIYRYFDGKEEILSVLRYEGFQLFLQHQEKVMHIEDPLKRLVAGGYNYLEFAQQQPEYFDLMFNIPSTETVLSGQWGERPLSTFENLRTMVKGCMESGWFDSDDLEAMAFALWSGVHGFASLMVKERIQALCPDADLDKLIVRVFDFMLRPWVKEDALQSFARKKDEILQDI